MFRCLFLLVCIIAVACTVRYSKHYTELIFFCCYFDDLVPIIPRLHLALIDVEDLADQNLTQLTRSTSI
jgi:hypothetical protein